MAAEPGAMNGTRTRRCIVTGDVLPEGRLVRFVAGPDARIVPDVEAKLPGRGIWVRAERKAVDQAVAKHLFSRAAQAAVIADPGLAGRTEPRLAQRILRPLVLPHPPRELILP